MNLPLKDRLLKAASLVGCDSGDIALVDNKRYAERTVVADVGCDHAYLSIYLVKKGRCDLAIASDLREGPILAAKENILKYGCAGKIIPLCTNGLTGLEVYSPSDIVICGMGGDTIQDILKDAPWVQRDGIRLILQPQSGAAELMLSLAAQGFYSYSERYAFDAGKPYRIFKFIYSGVGSLPTLEEAMIGKLSYDEDREAYLMYLTKLANTVEKKNLAIKRYSPDNHELDNLLDRIRRAIEKNS